MKASEIRKEQIADAIESAFCASSSEFGATMREAAARLRNVTVRTDNSAVIAELQRRLKVAEEALEKLQTICRQTEYAYGRSICDEALAAIRDEGGAKASGESEAEK